MTYQITTQAESRKLFWEQNPQFKRGVRLAGKSGGRKVYVDMTQNDYPTDVRVAFCDFVDYLQRDGQISEALAERVTL